MTKCPDPPKELLAMTWKTVSERLQRSIVEHYED